MAKPLILKAPEAALPARPVDVPPPERVKVAVLVPSANPAPAQNQQQATIGRLFDLKVEWPGVVLEFRQDGDTLTPRFTGNNVLDFGGYPRPNGWSNMQAEQARRWAVTCWQHLYDTAVAATAPALALYAQAAGAAVWNVIEALVEADDEVPAA